MSDIEFISNVQTLATNGTLIELLRRLEEDAVTQWKIGADAEEREECWHVMNAIQFLRNKIESLGSQDKVQEWLNRRIARRV
jgi:MoaA/NifB/PqqE/SkfB family radical SAM enzyme